MQGNHWGSRLLVVLTSTGKLLERQPEAVRVVGWVDFVVGDVTAAFRTTVGTIRMPESNGIWVIGCVCRNDDVPVPTYPTSVRNEDNNPTTREMSLIVKGVMTSFFLPTITSPSGEVYVVVATHFSQDDDAMIMSNGFVHLVRIVVEMGVVVFLLLSISSTGWSTGRRSPRTVSVCHGFSVFPSSIKGPTAAIPRIPSHSSLSSHASSRNPSPTATPITTTAATTTTTTGDDDDDEEDSLGETEVVVTRVETEQDWIAFADLRYDEWIVPPSNSSTGNRGSSGSSIVVPSRRAFRCATRDIYLEERPRSILVLAKRRKQQDDKHDDDDPKQEMVVMGGAEWSPYEVEAGLVAPTTTNDSTTSSSFSAGYVTDVVTAVPYRNQGIGRLIMTTLETLAVRSATATTSTTTTTTIPIDAQRQPPKTHFILLHVHPDNASALRFYQQQLGYTTTTTTTTLQSSELEKMLDIGKLEQEAGTEGQILLVKKLVIE
jgi:ribosomal protein S18 acetylase RimI-like enzyme